MKPPNRAEQRLKYRAAVDDAVKNSDAVVRMRRLLKRLEWSSERTWVQCPICNGIKPGETEFFDHANYFVGHSSRCALARELRQE